MNEEKENVEHDEYNKFSRNIMFLFDGKNWKELLDWCRKYLTTSILLISGLGSIIQIFELAKINIAYIRFFSATQVISDGALVIGTLILLIVSYKIFKSILLSQDIILLIKYKINKKKLSKGIADKRSILYFLAPVIFYVVVSSMGFRHFKENLFVSIICISILYVYLKASFIYSNYYYKYLETTPDNFKFKDLSLGISKWIGSVIIILTISSLVALIFLCLHAYKLPDNLENYTKVNQQVQKDYKNIESHEILYFNDNYLFVEINRKNRKSVAVYETKGVLFDKNIIVTQGNNNLSKVDDH